MTVALSCIEIKTKLEAQFPGSVIEVSDSIIVIRAELLLEIAAFLKTSPDIQLDYLSFITAVDYQNYFEVVYYLNSIVYNHSLLLKVRINERENPALPSVVSLWQGADFQEREVYDLMGISFEGHPNMKRIVLWDGFPGHPLRKDWRDGGQD